MTLKGLVARITLTFIGVTGGSGAFSHAHATSEFHWSLGPSLPLSVQEIYPAVHNNQIYVAGGLTAGKDKFSVSDQVFRISADADGWQTLPSFPAPTHHAMLASAGGSLWAFGGFTESEDGQWNNSSAVYQFDEMQAEWVKRNPMPVRLSESISAVINGKVHLAGGRTSKDENYRWQHHLDSDWHGIFDPDSKVWQTGAPLPTPRNSACSVVYDNKWHVIGGRTVEGGNTNVHEVFDVSTDEWKTEKPMPEAAAGIACAVLDDSIFVFGGGYFDAQCCGVFYKVWRYELKRKRWSEAAVMPVPRHGLGAVTFDNAIWLIGGAAEAGPHDTRHTVSKFTLMKATQ